MAEVTGLPAARGEQWPQHRLAGEDVGLEVGERGVVEARVGKGVVAELEPGIEPALEQPHPPGISDPGLVTELPLVHEPDGGDSGCGDGPDQGHGDGLLHRHGCGGSAQRQVIKGDGDVAAGSSLDDQRREEQRDEGRHWVPNNRSPASPSPGTM